MAHMANYIIKVFTFHYVSIKSDAGINSKNAAMTFTFHYVSIKSTHGAYGRLYYKGIYIPLCIY